MVKFSKISENEVTLALIEEFYQEFQDYLKVDVIVIGAGPSGLMAGKRLAENDIKTLVIESNNYLGGGFWLGGFLINTVTLRDPAQRILTEIGVPYKEIKPGLFVASGPHACSRLIASACDCGVKVLNMAKFNDVILKDNNKVAGAVINWSPVSALVKELSFINPIALESKLVIDASGHDAVVAKTLKERGLLEVKGCGSMWMERSEDLLVEQTGEVHPGLIVTGMAVATVYGLPRMGPTFGAMLYSGIKAATEALMILKPEESQKGKRISPVRRI